VKLKKGDKRLLDLLVLVPERSQLFIRSRNETLSIVAVRVRNKNRSPAKIRRWQLPFTLAAMDVSNKDSSRLKWRNALLD
jgi:hypothetical protein